MLLAKEHKDPQKVLIIHFGQLGDVVLGLPALRAARERFRDALITVMTGLPSAEIVRIADVADDVLAVDRVELRDGNRVRSIAKIFRLVRGVRQRRFDLVIDLHSLAETNLLGYLAGIPRRLYANRENRSLDRLGNFRPSPPAEDKSVHLAQRYLDVLRPLGTSSASLAYRFPGTSLSVATLQTKLGSRFQEIEGAVGLFPGAGHASRRWSIDKFAELAQVLVNDGRKVAVFLGPEEMAIKSHISKMMPHSVAIIDRLTLNEFIPALSRLALFVCNDTGPAHLAACAGTGLVLLLDERAPLTYLPMTTMIEVVRGRTIHEISVDAVHAAAGRLLSKAANNLP
jgi:ADP-heptose:LPS heptosyltransferase